MASFQVRTTADGKKRIRVQVRPKGLKAVTKTFARMGDAKIWARRMEVDIDSGKLLPEAHAKRMTVANMIERYLADIMPRKPKSLKQQTSQLNWWEERLGNLYLSDVSRGLVNEHRDKLAKKTSPANANRYMAVLRHAFNVAVDEWEWIEDSPIRKIKKLKEPRGRARYLSDSELVALLNACRNDSDRNLYPVVMVAVSTGMRKQEILDLTWDRVDLEKGVIKIDESKNDERRSVPLVSHARKVLEKHGSIRRIDCDYVFPASTKPKPADIDRQFARARDRAEIEDFRFHDLRHTAATYLAMNGTTITDIAAILGHKNIQMTMRYSHHSPSHLSGVVESMNDAIFMSESS